MMRRRPSFANRRKFLAQAGGLAAVAAGAPFGIGLVDALAKEFDHDGRFDDDDHHDRSNQRANEAYRIRHEAALFHRKQPSARHLTNGDERQYANAVGNFTKTLPHTMDGLVVPEAYAALRHAMSTADPADFDVIPRGGVAKLSNPQSAFAFQMDGADSHQLGIRVPPAFASAETAGEMEELYWLALTRDVPYASYDTDVTIAAAASAQSHLSDFRGPKAGGAVTPGTIFRGNFPGELSGPFISQFLLKDVPFGPYVVPQKVRAGLAGVEYMTDYAAWLNVQNGSPTPVPPFQTVPAAAARYLNDNRALSAYLRADFSPQGFINASLILNTFGLNALSPSNPYRASLNQSGQGTFGGGEFIGMIAHAAHVALLACWFQKWAVHRKVRPEAFGGAIHNMKTTTARYDIHPEILDSPVVTTIQMTYGTYLLPMAYPEGSPTHPSYPAGHAAMAGAGATMLKAFYDETFVIPSLVVASADGTALVPYTGTPLTVGNELNKLASNISLGRDASGVHWRSDGTEGMALGEAAAIAVLQDLRNCYNENFEGFSFTRFDGTRITI
jgi:membrane-associated phospholipid phosphatase